MPFDGSNFKRLVKQISQGDYYEPRNASPASPLIREMLTVCPKKRASIETICSHWWVNEGYKESCLDLAEELANQTPVRLDVLLSLTPSSITADQLVVPTPVQESKSTDRVARSHSVGSVIDLANTEAERRIIDMVAQGGEAALMPSPTRIMTPAESPAQPKRKLEQTVSTENATGGAKKKEKPIDPTNASKLSIPEHMEVETVTPSLESEIAIPQQADLAKVEKICDELIETPQVTPKKVIKKKIVTPEKVPQPPPVSATVSAQPTKVSSPKESPVNKPTPVIEKTEPPSITPAAKAAAEKKKSRIFETAEKFQNMNNQNTEKAKKFGGVMSSVGNFKKEYEKRASLTGTNLIEKPISPEKKPILPQEYKPLRKTSLDDSKIVSVPESTPITGIQKDLTQNKLNDSRSSIASFSLEEARRSMENSIALLNQVKFNQKTSTICFIFKIYKFFLGKE